LNEPVKNRIYFYKRSKII